MDIVTEFRRIRENATPWCLVQTPDWRVVIKSLSEIRMADETSDIPILVWDVVRGVYPLNDLGRECCSAFEETQGAPALMLRIALGSLPPNAMMFMVVSDNRMMDDAMVGQGIANLRDEFKKTRRTLTIVGDRGLKAHSFVIEDIPVLQEELPDDEKLIEIAKTVYEVFKCDPNDEESLSQIKDSILYCRGLTGFAAEETLSRCFLTKSKRFHRKRLAEAQRLIVEQTTNKALRFETAELTFDHIGGMAEWRWYMERLFSGKGTPELVVRVDEIDKEVTAASTGTVADNTGTSQYQLKQLLTVMETNNYPAALLVGCPGSGKTLSTICTGNQFKRRTLVFDMGSTKQSLVGSSEANMRTAMDIIAAIGGKKVLFLATANRLDTIPEELQRRFTLGTWYFSMPTDDELQTIWKIQRKLFGIDEKQPTPISRGWVGSDVRNCCRLANDLSITLQEAAKRITLVSKASAKTIARLEQLAVDCGWLSASYPGPYRGKEKEAESNGAGKKVRAVAIYSLYV